MTQQSHSWAYTWTIFQHIPGLYFKNYNSKRCRPPYIYSNIIHNSQDRETPKSLLTDKWIKKLWYIYTVQYYSALKENEIMVFAAIWMQLEIIILNEISQKEKDNYPMIWKTVTLWYDLSVESEIWHKWTYLRNRNTLTDIENRLVVCKERVGREKDGLGIWA